jgi:WD40 repeat protein
MDNTAKLWDLETGTMILDLNSHSAEVISLNFTSEGD